MSLRIVTADDRLREAQGKTTMALSGLLPVPWTAG
jgi:hypothetical protein